MIEATEASTRVRSFVAFYLVLVVRMSILHCSVDCMAIIRLIQRRPAFYIVYGFAVRHSNHFRCCLTLGQITEQGLGRGILAMAAVAVPAQFMNLFKMVK